MNALTDQQLLHEYAASRSESAFRELVRRHIDLVHSAARRLVRDSHIAEDVTQAVFTALSKDARKVASHPVLAGWLHQTTRHLSTNVIRADARRRLREQQAIVMNPPASEPEPLWADIASHLDSVLGELSEADRDAVILRFFQKRSAKEIATTLGISAEAAQKRVNRAIERLRESFARRGVTGSGAGLTAAINSHAVQAAPSGLAATIAAGVLASAVATTTTTTTLLMTTLSKIFVPAAVVALGGTWLVQSREADRLRAEIDPAMQAQAANLRASFATVGGSPAEAAGFGGTTVGDEEPGEGAATGEAGGGFSVAAGAMVDGEWFGAGPGPEPVSLDSFGRPTTAMVETLELTDDEVVALGAAIGRIRGEAIADFVKRVKFTGSVNQEDGVHYSFQAPARPDRGQYFFDAFTKAFTDAIGESRGRRFRDAMAEDAFLAGMGKYDLEFDFVRATEGEIRVRYTTRVPGSTEDPGSFQGNLEGFEERFGKVFEFSADGAPHPKAATRGLPETR